ncbi:iron-hydroxamate ABC transporter substrate-binding protein [Oceanobacillus halotolerans]|uniref:iron-hydroxamate ABC transporter substrate-binding protein n=1 Tax=Oceanobacillus halotolerans TaxID=2663380 RepID=UPI0013DBEB44|nr:iron-hydroxamate ABC transporter substrate-binding protein [Oceanobacillus halotolerans]
MKSYKTFYGLGLLVISILLLALTACGSDDETEQDETNDTKNESDSITLDSEMGEFTVPSEIDRVIAPYHEDALLALGVTPVAKWAIGESIQDYLETDLQDIPPIEWNMPLEQVLQHEPDLIILEHNLDSYEGTYDDYNKIAPTYVMKEETTTSWRNQLEVFGTLLGKETEAEEALANYEDKVATASKELEEALNGETIAAIWATGDEFFLFEKDRHSMDVIYNELGVNVPSLVESLGEAEAQWNPISLEKLSELDADHVFLLAEEGEQGVDTLENSSVWKNTPAAQNDQVYIMEDPSNWTNKGVIASEKTIDAVLDVIGNE